MKNYKEKSLNHKINMATIYCRKRGAKMKEGDLYFVLGIKNSELTIQKVGTEIKKRLPLSKEEEELYVTMIAEAEEEGEPLIIEI